MAVIIAEAFSDAAHSVPLQMLAQGGLVLGLRDHYRCIVPDHIGMGLSDKPSPCASCVRAASSSALA